MTADLDDLFSIFITGNNHCKPIPSKVANMLLHSFFALVYFISINAKHFDGGTIRWEPVNPYDTVSPITISIIQSYSWAYPTVNCSKDVPITSKSSRGPYPNANLTCVADCASDGGYSANPINILTDCQSVSTSLGIMSSQGTKNVSLSVGAHFYLAFEGSAWVALNDPPEDNLAWSIVTYIDLRIRSDGFINTPPVATVMSPQYAFVNQTMQIPIPVSDANARDTVRCRWSAYIPGYRRRRDARNTIHKLIREKSSIEKRQCCSKSEIIRTWHNTRNPFIILILGGRGTATVTSSYPNRQPIDECGGICYPDSLPNGTTLSNCVLNFTGYKANTWYGVAIQVIS